MANKLPGRVAPLELARRHARIEATVPVARFRRLAEALYAADSDVSVDLAFELVDRDIAIVRGSLQAELRVLCQRCLQPMWQRLDLKPALQFRTKGVREPVADEEGALEPVEMDTDETVDLAELVEDELILGLPTVARHAPESCPAKRMRFGPALAEKPAEEGNPFAVLKDLVKPGSGRSES